MTATATQLHAGLEATGSAYVSSAVARRDAQRRHFDGVAAQGEGWRKRHAYYHRSVARLVRFLVGPGRSVLDVGCGMGDLLAALEPSQGLGIDLSPRMIETARARHPALEFQVADAQELDLGGRSFDVVLLSDVLCLVDDVWQTLRTLQRVCRPETRIVITGHNAVWQGILNVADALGVKTPTRPTSWLGMADVQNLLHLNHYEVVSQGTSTLIPTRVPLVSELVNRTVAHLPGVRAMNLIYYLVARPTWQDAPPRPRDLSCSVIVPTRNEKGNVRDIFARTPQLGPRTELVFVDGHSSDGTVEEIERLLPTREARLYHQTGKGKGDAVRLGFARATGDVLMILDSDLTVPPEDLPKFYLALAEGRGEFVNGTRLVYPMEDEAMRFLNLLGNKFFSVVLSAILGQPLKDTLCGTKVLTREAYARIEAGRVYFGEFDPFGDFDLIFGAAKQQLKIVEVPIRYQARTYGETKIHRFRHGWLLLRMSGLALWKFKLSQSDA